MIRSMIVLTTVALSLTPMAPASQAGVSLTSVRTDRAPSIDGSDADPVWAKAKEVVTHDTVADIDIVLKSVYTQKDIFFLVSFPDSDESRTHKSWVWDREERLYRQGPDREDVFVIKWNMTSDPVDLRLSSEDIYTADIWYWKATRTDPVGYADDKTHRILIDSVKGSRELTSRNGHKKYLLRSGDEGAPAYKTGLQVAYAGDTIPRFSNHIPTGSRGDVRARGQWKEGRWTIEFARSLRTGNDDDINFDANRSFQFGVSRYEIAGKTPDPDLSQPLYGSGDIGDDLLLRFGR